MKKGEFKFVIAVVSLVVAFAVFFGGYWVYNHYGVEKPLADQINSISGVKHVAITNQDDKLLINVELKYVDDLQIKYKEIQDTIDKQKKNDQYQLQIKDHRNKKLQKAYDNIQLMVYEAAANNRFLWLKEQVKPELTGLTYNIFVDENRLYIQIKDGDYYLYEIINRQQENTGLK